MRKPKYYPLKMGDEKYAKNYAKRLHTYLENKIMRNYKLERLDKGETFITKEKGNSMMPRLKSGQEHKIAPTDWTCVEVGDIVYCKVKGNYYTHLVKAIDNSKGVLIGNNKGRINGWTKNVYGVVIEILN